MSKSPQRSQAQSHPPLPGALLLVLLSAALESGCSSDLGGGDISSAGTGSVGMAGGVSVSNQGGTLGAGGSGNAAGAMGGGSIAGAGGATTGGIATGGNGSSGGGVGNAGMSGSANAGSGGASSGGTSNAGAGGKAGNGGGGNAGSASGGKAGAGGASGNGGSSTAGTSGTNGTSGTGGTGSVDPYASARQTCVDRVNTLRASKGKGPIPRLASAESCADSQAKKDSESGVAHSAFGDCVNQVQGWTGAAQNECPGYGSVASTLSTCIDQMWAEGPGGGHYDNMMSDSDFIACGFYTTPGGKVWMIQDFWSK